MTSSISARSRLGLSLRIASALVMLGGLPAWTAARTAPLDEEHTEIQLRLPAAPARSEAALRRNLALLDHAAMRACGAEDGSFAQVRAAVRASACWHQAMIGALDQTHDARLKERWSARYP